MKAVLPVMLLLLAPAAAQADGPGWEHRRNLLQEPVPEDLDTSQTIEGKYFIVSYKADTPDGKPPFGRIHDWTVIVTPKEPTKAAPELAFSGEMPQHLHGLPTRIEVHRLPGARFRIEGLKFHMLGWWRFKMRVTAGSRLAEDFVFHQVF